jgi:hypothetical protein
MFHYGKERRQNQMNFILTDRSDRGNEFEGEIKSTQAPLQDLF